MNLCRQFVIMIQHQKNRSLITSVVSAVLKCESVERNFYILDLQSDRNINNSLQARKNRTHKILILKWSVVCYDRKHSTLLRIFLFALWRSGYREIDINIYESYEYVILLTIMRFCAGCIIAWFRQQQTGFCIKTFVC